MGWQMLVGDDLAQGRLIKLGTQEIISEATYNLVAAHVTKASSQVDLVKTWLAQELLT